MNRWYFRSEFLNLSTLSILDQINFLVVACACRIPVLFLLDTSSILQLWQAKCLQTLPMSQEWAETCLCMSSLLMQSKLVNLLLCKFTHWLMSNSLFGDSPAVLFHFLLRGKGKKEMLSWRSSLLRCNFKTGKGSLEATMHFNQHFTSLKEIQRHKTCFHFYLLFWKIYAWWEFPTYLICFK